MSKTWMIRAGEGANYIDRFISENVVALGSLKAEDASHYSNQGQYYEYLLTAYPEWKQRRVSITAGQIYRFYHEIQQGDWVLSYVPEQREYLVGKVLSNAERINGDPEFGHVRKVEWKGRVGRDSLSVSSRNTLGAISTLFLLSEEAASEVIARLEGRPTEPEAEVEITNPEAESETQDMLFDDLQARSMEFLKDQIMKLDWEEMQEIVAGLLRAMGYKTSISPSGPDRGKDVTASPDGFGFEDPRIVVEVKHRKGAMGAPEIRSFLGGRHATDKGLYVSSGGFSREAYYEAERANIRLTLMNLDDFAKAIIQHYENLDLDIKQLLPMRRLYWPI